MHEGINFFKVTVSILFRNVGGRIYGCCQLCEYDSSQKNACFFLSLAVLVTCLEIMQCIGFFNSRDQITCTIELQTQLTV